jgi:hypothetical protein
MSRQFSARDLRRRFSGQGVHSPKDEREEGISGSSSLRFIETVFNISLLIRAVNHFGAVFRRDGANLAAGELQWTLCGRHNSRRLSQDEDSPGRIT